MTEIDRSIQEYLTYLRVRRNLAINTLESYGQDLKDFTRYAAGHGAAQLTSLSRTMLRGYLAVKKEQTGISSATLARHISSLRGWLKYVADVHPSGLPAASNLLSFGQRLKRSRSLPRALAKDQVEKLLDFSSRRAQEASGRSRLPSLRDWAALEVLYSSGLRISELCGLPAASVEWEQGMVRVMGKGAKERMAPMGERALKALKFYWKEYQHRVKRPQGHYYLFANPCGAP
ncbi:MAG: tyrosine-type recombinase/integrase, partial [Elusimicrobiota bacterium]